MFYGVVFVPIIYVQENVQGASQRGKLSVYRCVPCSNQPSKAFIHLFSLGIDYIFSIGLGALLASTLYFIIYGLLTRNRPEIPRPASILPSLVAGVLCGTGQACWLVANEALQASVTFPIAATLPGAIATLIGTVFYREVQVREPLGRCGRL